MASEPDIALGVDIGGTRVRVGVITADGKVRAHIEDRLPTDGDPEQLAALVKRQTAHVIERSECRPELAGVALPGVWERETGVMQRAVNLPRLEGVDLPAMFRNATGCTIRLEADVNAGVWGQYRALSPRPERLVYISLGTGIGGSVILDGKILQHTRGGAGHFGFLIADTAEGAPAGRNKVPGCLSAIAAGPALHLAATGTTDYEAIGDEEFPDEVVNYAARGLAVAIFNLVHLFAPEIVLLGGGVIDNHAEIVDATRTAFAQRQSSLILLGMRIEKAPLTTHEAGVIGAALLALRATTATPR